MKRGLGSVNKGISGGFFVFILLLTLYACQSDQAREDAMPDTPERGRIYVSADESFKPIVDELVKVYESNNSGTEIKVLYKPEAECLTDLLVDSIRMVIATRGLLPPEENYIVDSLKLAPQSMVVARDAIAVIVNPAAQDSVFTMAEIRQILQGKFKKNLIPVFDGVKATSTVRFIIDSVLHGDTITSRAMAARSSEAVVDFVAKNPGTVGFIGVSWIGNKEDTAQVGFLKKVKIAQLESTDVPGGYVLPVQNNIYLHRYPMVRDLVYIRKEKHKGLGYGFAQFMSGHIGQLIFKRAYLVPTQKKYTLRPIRLNE